MQLHIYKTEELIDELAKWILNYATGVLFASDRFTIALSGGETPKRLYQHLATDAYRDKIEWGKFHVFWGDERVVPFADDNNNARTAFENLLSNVNIPQDNIHIMRTDISPVIAAEEYEKTLHNYFDFSDTSFDLVLLGMGKDGHTLSLFPGFEVTPEQQNWVNAVYLDDQKMHRITLMPSIVNRSSKVVFLVTGSEKANALQQVLKGTYEPVKYPAQLINPASGELHWFIDENAAREIYQIRL
jgi:6-phosphogluconolactonase